MANDYMMAIIEAVRRLGGHQIIELEECYALLGGKGEPSAMPRETHEALRQLLKDFGYRERWTIGDDGTNSGYRWVRSAWTIDAPILAKGAVEAFHPFD